MAQLLPGGGGGGHFPKSEIACVNAHIDAGGLLSLCFAMAFLSFWWQASHQTCCVLSTKIRQLCQADGLVGPKGIVPIAEQVPQMGPQMGAL